MPRIALKYAEYQFSFCTTIQSKLPAVNRREEKNLLNPSGLIAEMAFSIRKLTLSPVRRLVVLSCNIMRFMQIEDIIAVYTISLMVQLLPGRVE
jgi:hypothetical protein